MIRVALCITELDLGGAERCLTDLAIRVDRRRFTPTVYCLGPRPARDDASCLPALETAGVEVHCLGGKTMWQFPLVVARLKRLLVVQNPQIIQTFLFHANVLGRIAARRARVEFVVSGIRVAERASRWHLWLDRLTAGWVDRYVCVSRPVAEFSQTRGGLPASKLVVIPNGVDLDRFPAPQTADLSALGVPAGRRVVTFVGRLHRQKGVEWLIETAGAWLARLPDHDLLLVGTGPLQDRLESACRTAGITDRVHFAGWRGDVPEILTASDLLVLPSAWEGMPNVVLEAMASRRPVVATDVEGVRELLGPSAALQLVPYGNTQELINKIVGLMSDPAMAAAVGQQNRRRVEDQFPISRTISAYEDLWTSLATG
jgi:glycosyltransferase involved in cell wall biosynthesis